MGLLESRGASVRDEEADSDTRGASEAVEALASSPVEASEEAGRLATVRATRAP